MPLTDVNPIASIIKTIDRNLALLLGRALDAQKFFYSVTYDHQFRDSSSELYQFRPKLTPFVSRELVAAPDAHHANGDDEGKSPDHENKDEHDKSNMAHGLSVGPADLYEKESSPTTATLVRPRRQASELDETPLLSPDGCVHIVDGLLRAHMFEDQLCYTIGCHGYLTKLTTSRAVTSIGSSIYYSKQSTSTRQRITWTSRPSLQ